MPSPNKTTAQLVSDLATAVVQNQSDRQPRAVGFDEIIPKKARLDVTMTPSLERSKTVGSPLQPMYWCERVYQAMVSGLYGNNPKDAYKGVIRQAEKTGLSEPQRKEIARYLSALGIDIGESEQENLNEPYKMTADEKREAAQEDVTGRIVAAVRSHLGQDLAIQRLGKAVAEAKRKAAFTKRTATAALDQRLNNDLRGYSKAVCKTAGDAETCYRVAKAQMSGERSASLAAPAIRKASALVVRCISEGRDLLKQGFSHSEVAKHIAQTPLSSTPLGPVEQQIKTQPGVKQTVKTDDKGKPAIVVQQDSTPPIKTAGAKEPKCRKCGKRYPEAGDGWDGMCPDCADKAEENGSADEQRIAAATRQLCGGMAEGEEAGGESEAPGTSREALLNALDEIHQSGGATLPIRDVVASQIESGEITDLEHIGAELARKMAE